ncbi:cytochrome C oxidase subunit II, partial [Stenotrophomonas acidaminiphila]
MTPINAFTSDSAGALPLHVLDKATFAAWLDAQPAATQAWLSSQQFTAAPGSVALLPGSDGLAGAVLGVGDRADAHAYAHAPFALPAGS